MLFRERGFVFAPRLQSVNFLMLLPFSEDFIFADSYNALYENKRPDKYFIYFWFSLRISFELCHFSFPGRLCGFLSAENTHDSVLVIQLVLLLTS